MNPCYLGRMMMENKVTRQPYVRQDGALLRIEPMVGSTLVPSDHRLKAQISHPAFSGFPFPLFPSDVPKKNKIKWISSFVALNWEIGLKFLIQ